MSSIWTPSGEHQPSDGPPGGSAPGPNGDPPAPPDPSPEEIEALREVHARLVATPVEDVIAKAADTVLAEQLEKQKGDEVLAPSPEGDDPAAREKFA